MEAERVATALREDIVSGVFASGEVLRQERLAETYSSSRMPVRDAFRILEGQGLVILKPNKGAVVAGLDAHEFREIYEMRSVLEVLALRLAIPEFTNRHLDEIADLQSRAETSELRAFGQFNKMFHVKLYEPSSRPRLLSQIAMLNDLADRYLRVAAVHLDYQSRSHREHRVLLKACRRRDEQAAVTCLQRHIEVAGRSLYTLLANRLPRQK